MTPRTIDVFDELAALFLTEPDTAASDATAPTAGNGAGAMRAADAEAMGRCASANGAARAVVEGIIVGHLPVRASLWLGPYADALARQHGPTALVRLGDEGTTIELFRARDLRELHQPADVRHAMGQLSTEVETWIVRPDPATTPAELAAASVDRITILTGANDAASVALYQTIKELVEASRQGGRALPPLSLAVLGCDRQRAIELVQRLNRTTSTFLGLEVGLSLCAPHMDAGIRSSGYWSFDPQEAPKLGQILQWIRDAATQRIGPNSRPLSDPAKPAPASMPAIASRAAAAEGMDVGALTRPTGPAVRVAPKPTPMPVPPALAPAPIAIQPASRPPSLAPVQSAGAQYLAAHIEGVAPLPVRCPGHERIELAVDPRGRMHVIGRESDLRELWPVAAWAKAHRELIAMACPQQPLDPAAAVVRHLFTDRPLAVADLHASDLQLHILAPVLLGDQTGWYAAPLNAVAV